MEGSNVSRDTSHIPKFDGGNFHTWKFGLMLLMRNFNLQDIIIGEELIPLEVKYHYVPILLTISRLSSFVLTFSFAFVHVFLHIIISLMTMQKPTACNLRLLMSSKLFFFWFPTHHADDNVEANSANPVDVKQNYSYSLHVNLTT